MRPALIFLLLFPAACALGTQTSFDEVGAVVPDAGHAAQDASPRDASPPPIDAPLEVSTTAADAQAADAGRDAAVVETGPVTCTRTITVTSVIPSSSGCTLNEEVRSAGPATLTYPCAGGAATVRFGSQTFTGTVTGSTVALTNVDPFPFSSCTWESTQRISGTMPSLSYSYSERVVSGGCSGVGACTASGSATTQ